jgi:hypothetical protein
MIATDIISCTAAVATVIIAVVDLYTWKREFISNLPPKSGVLYTIFKICITARTRQNITVV